MRTHEKRYYNQEDLINTFPAIVNVPIPVDQGIYFLFLDNKIVYIGKTINCIRRIGNHVDVKAFDKAYFLPIKDRRLSSIELTFIKFFSPEYNDKRDKKEITEYEAELINLIFTNNNMDFMLRSYLKISNHKYYNLLKTINLNLI